MATSAAPSTLAGLAVIDQFAQGCKPAAPANGNVIKRYILTSTTFSDQTEQLTLPVSNPSSWAS